MCVSLSGDDRPIGSSYREGNNKKPASSYGVFLWNGKSADAVTKATALTKAFELERILLDDGNVERFFNGDGAVSALTQALSGGKINRGLLTTEPTVMQLLEGNELFRWLVNGPRSSFNTAVPQAWPHVSEAIQTGKRERGDEDLEPTRKRGGSLGSPRGANNKQGASPGAKGPGLQLNMGKIGQMDIEEKRVELGKSESAQRQAELDKYRGICSEILPFLFVGAEVVARDKDLMKSHGITHVVNSAGTVLDNFHPNDFAYLRLYLYDAKTEDLGCLFYEVIEFIEKARESGGKVFIHCHQGVSRSCSLVISYLINQESLTYEQGFDKVKAIRGICNPNAGFICQLLEFQRRMREPMDRPRAFRIAKHSNFPDSSYCARNASPGAGAPKREECIVLHTPTRLFLWRGEACDAGTLASAEQHIKRLQQFEGAPGAVEHLAPGTEPPAFWKAAAECGFSVPAGATGSPGREAALASEAARDVYNLEEQRNALAAEDEANRTPSTIQP